MNNDKPLLRILAAGVPLVLIGLVFGLIGYSTAEPETTPIPPLAEADPGTLATQGEIVSFSGDRLALVTEAGETLDFAVAADASVEVMEPISLEDIAIGDWLNGGAIPHPDTVLALVRLILLPEPVTP